MPGNNAVGVKNTRCTRRLVLQSLAAGATLVSARPMHFCNADERPEREAARPWISIRGIYGGYPREVLDRGETPANYGINAIWVGSGSLDATEIDRYRKLGLKVFAEFNSLHAAEYLKEHPDAAPIGTDGKPSPPPQGWQGVSAFHRDYRRDRMAEFRRVLQTFEIDGIWLDYHHAHASWERAEPELPDTDFSPAALNQFSEKSGITLPTDTAAAAKVLLGKEREAWTNFRCDVFTDWVREYREILDDVRPKALIGTFHCPWSQDEYEGAIRHKLAIDLKAQAKYLDIFSIMPYHARFGHAEDPAWISRQVQKLGELLKIQGKPDEKNRIWPIAQLSDWGSRVPFEQVAAVLDHGTRSPATGVMVFHWSGVSKEWSKVKAMQRKYLAFRGS
ncbi:MAG TPA: hypothetical protein VFV87_15740 [Pirellulaceae bacterium]|nr:hypothetical protein [Pirellulaceae bacterium]